MTERLRPLPKEMLEYARSDTHFLLFIYDNLRNALLDRAPSRSQFRTSGTLQPQANIGPSNFDPRHSLLQEVLSCSEETSLRLHQTESYDGEEGSGTGGWDTIARKWNKVAFTKVAHRSIPKSIYLRIHDWRDRVAREEDESTACVFREGFLFHFISSYGMQIRFTTALPIPACGTTAKRSSCALEYIPSCAACHQGARKRIARRNAGGGMQEHRYQWVPRDSGWSRTNRQH